MAHEMKRLEIAQDRLDLGVLR